MFNLNRPGGFDLVNVHGAPHVPGSEHAVQLEMVVPVALEQDECSGKSFLILLFSSGWVFDLLFCFIFLGKSCILSFALKS